MPEAVSFDPLATPHSVVDAALAGAPSAVRSPVDEVLFPAKPAAPAAPAAPEGPEQVEFDPTTTAFSVVRPAPKPVNLDLAETPHQKIFTLDYLKNTPLDQLDKEKELEPTEFGLEHEGALNADPEARKKLLELYNLRETPLHYFHDMSPGEIALDAVKTAARIPGGLLKLGGSILSDVLYAVKHANETYNPIEVVPRLLGAGSVSLQAGQGPKVGEAGIADEVRRLAGKTIEFPASLDLVANRTTDLLSRGLRTTGESLTALDPTGLAHLGGKAYSELTPAEKEARFRSDVAQKRSIRDAAAGSGWLVKALGNSKEELAQSGIEIDPASVERLSTVTDPLNWVLLGEGAAVGAVGKVGGRFTVEQVAKAATKEQASFFVKTMNEASVMAGKAVSATGQGLETAGNALREKAFKPLGDLGNVGAVVAAAGGSVGAGAGIAAVTKLTPKALELTGRALKSASKVVPAGVQIGGDLAKEFAIGYGHGLLFTVPFMIGATPTEREGLLAAAALGGVARAGVRGGGYAARGAQEGLAKSIFEHVKQSEPPPTFDYSTDLGLDSASRVNTAKLDKNSQNFLGRVKNLFKDSGVEFYPLTDEQFLRQTGGRGGRGFALDMGQSLAPDGTTKPFVRVFLNGDVSALPHEMLHALGNVDAPGYREFVKTVDGSLQPGERRMFEQIYNSVQNNGLPESQWTRRLSPEKLSEEIAAEAFSRVVLGQDLSGVKPALARKGHEARP